MNTPLNILCRNCQRYAPPAYPCCPYCGWGRQQAVGVPGAQASQKEPLNRWVGGAILVFLLGGVMLTGWLLSLDGRAGPSSKRTIPSPSASAGGGEVLMDCAMCQGTGIRRPPTLLGLGDPERCRFCRGLGKVLVGPD